MLLAIALSLALPPPTEVPTPPTIAPSQSQTLHHPNPDARGRYHIGDCVTIPTLTYKVDPTYTKDARKQKVAGIALVSILVDVDGSPRDVHILRSVADSLDEKHNDQKHLAAAQSLDQAAVDAVKQYKFKPAMFQGRPVPVNLNVEVNFRFF